MGLHASTNCSDLWSSTAASSGLSIGALLGSAGAGSGLGTQNLGATLEW